MDTAAHYNEGDIYENRSQKKRNSIGQVVGADPQNLYPVRRNHHRIEGNFLGHYVGQGQRRHIEKGDPLEPAVRSPADPLLHESQKGSRESETQQRYAYDRRSKIRPAPYGKGTHDGDLVSDQAEREQEERPYAKVDLLHQSD